MKTTQLIKKLSLPIACLVLSSALSGCTTSSKDGTIVGAGLLWEQRGESSAKIDGDQIANVLGKVNDLAQKVENVATVGGQALKAADAVRTIADKANASASAAKADASTAKADASTAKTDASAAKDKSTDLSAKVDLSNQLLVEAKKTLATYDDKISKMSADDLQRLENVKNDDVKFRDEVHKSLADVGLTAAQIKAVQEKTKGLSTEEIIGLLAAAGAGGALGKTGKSRAQPEVDALKTKVAELDHSTVKKA